MTSMYLKISDIYSADGKEVYTDVQGAHGSYQCMMDYELLAYNLVSEFVPASGASLEGVEAVELWLSNPEALSFDSILVSYTDTNAVAQTKIYSKEECSYVNQGVDGVLMNIPITAEMQAGKNVLISLTNLVSNDDTVEEISAIYNKTLLEYVYIDPEVGAMVPTLEHIEMAFDEGVSLTPMGTEAVSVTTRMGQTVTEARLNIVMGSRARAVEVIFAEPLTEAGVYLVKIAAGAIIGTSGAVNEEMYLMYEVTGGGHAIITFNPADSSVVESLKEIIVSYEGGCHPSWNGVAQLLDESGAVVAKVEVSDYIPADKQADYEAWMWEPESSLLTLSKEITAPFLRLYTNRTLRIGFLVDRHILQFEGVCTDSRSLPCVAGFHHTTDFFGRRVNVLNNNSCLCCLVGI